VLVNLWYYMSPFDRPRTQAFIGRGGAACRTIVCRWALPNLLKTCGVLEMVKEDEASRVLLVWARKTMRSVLAREFCLPLPFAPASCPSKTFL